MNGSLEDKRKTTTESYYKKSDLFYGYKTMVFNY